MTAAKIVPFTHGTQSHAFADFEERGFRQLIPITPPGCLLYEKSSLALTLRAGKDKRGKAPGIKGADGLWRGVDWLHLEATPEKVRSWGAMGTGVGLRLGNGCAAVDFDLTDERLCEKTLRIFCELAPGRHRVRTGRAPKFLILVAPLEELAYRRVDFANGQRVEFLGMGRQCVLAGIHPITGRPYFWHGDDLPRFAELVAINAETLGTFFDRLAKLPEATSRVLSETTSAGDFPNQTSLVGKLDDVKRAVAALPNTSAAFPGREDYLKVGYGIKAALRDHPDEAFALFDDWCGRWTDPPLGGGNDPDIAFADWSRMHAPFKIGADWLYKLAEEFGSFDRATIFFGPVSSNEHSADPEAWPRPSDIFGDGSDGPPAELAAGVLPTVLGDAAFDMAERIGVSTAFAGAAVFATASAAVGSKLKIQPRQFDTDWLQPAFLWVGLIEDPGGKKSPILSAAAAPLSKLDARTAAQGRRAVDQWQHRKKQKNAPFEPKPAIERYVVDDYTMEALTATLAENPQGVLISKDELTDLVTSLDAYKSAKGADRASLLRLFDAAANVSIGWAPA